MATMDRVDCYQIPALVVAVESAQFKIKFNEPIKVTPLRAKSPRFESFQSLTKGNLKHLSSPGIIVISTFTLKAIQGYVIKTQT